jgi:uncharacterized protein (TIGR00661 family)
VKRIFYGVNGEGLGHVARTLAVVDALPDCEVHIFTFGKALKFLQDMEYPFVHEIEGMMFKYTGKHVSYIKSGVMASRFFKSKMKHNVAYIQEMAKSLSPALYIADFEPSVPRAAEEGKSVTIDNQHRFVYCDLYELPWHLRAYSSIVSLWTKNLVPNPDHVIVSTFHYDRIKKTYNNVHLVEGLVRKSVEENPVSNDGHIVIYLRRSVNDAILKAIRPIQREFHIYGASDTRFTKKCLAQDNFWFHPLSPRFVEDVASCDRIIATAGHQLLTEARFFGKSMLAVPEPMQYEQYINAYYAEVAGFAERCHIGGLTTRKVESFLNRTLTHSEVPNGVHKVKDILGSLL